MKNQTEVPLTYFIVSNITIYQFSPVEHMKRSKMAWWKFEKFNLLSIISPDTIFPNRKLPKIAKIK